MDRIGGERGFPGKTSQESPIVKCDVCGQHFNRRHLASHKRRSHGKSSNPTLGISDEGKTVEMILALYLQLSTAAKTNVLERLTSLS